MEINRLFDHTVLGNNVNLEKVKKLAEEAVKYNFFSICIPASWIKPAKELLKGSNVKITTVISFPHGNDTTEVKAFAAKDAIKKGADEIDMVIDIGKFREHDYAYILNDIKEVKKACGKNILKVIIETSELTPEEIKKASEICVQAKADFVKTSTGFTSSGASLDDVKIMKDAVNGKAQIKASGGIRTLEDVQKYQELNVERIGASKSVEIVEEYLKKGDK